MTGMPATESRAKGLGDAHAHVAARPAWPEAPWNAKNAVHPRANTVREPLEGLTT